MEPWLNRVEPERGETAQPATMSFWRKSARSQKKNRKKRVQPANEKRNRMSSSHTYDTTSAVERAKTDLEDPDRLGVEDLIRSGAPYQGVGAIQSLVMTHS